MSDLVKITNHTEIALDSLLEQYKGKPNFEGLISVIGGRTQDLEDIFCQILESSGVLTATGFSLDIIGDIVGQPRLGFDDDFYRILILARICENTSEGDLEKIINATKILTGATETQVQEWFPKGWGVGINTQLDPELINFMYDRLDRLDVASTRLEGIWCYEADTGFAFDGTQSDALGLSSINNTTSGGTLAGLHIRTEPKFSFEARAGIEDGDEGFSSIHDVYAGGILQGL